MTRKKRRRNEEQCAYCGIARICEIEHVFPESWYPDGHMPSQMLTVPACAGCNRDLGKVEERLFLLFAATMPDSDARLAGIRERARRATDPSAARPNEDPRYREARKKRLVGQFRIFEDEDDPQLRMWNPLPRVRQSLVTPAGLHVSGFHAIEFPMTDLSALGSKLARGCHFAVFGAALDRTCPIFTQTFNREPSELYAAFDREPGVARRGIFPFVARIGTVDDGVSTAWVFSLWDHVVLLVNTGPLAELSAEKAVSKLRYGPARELA